MAWSVGRVVWPANLITVPPCPTYIGDFDDYTLAETPPRQPHWLPDRSEFYAGGGGASTVLRVAYPSLTLIESYNLASSALTFVIGSDGKAYWADSAIWRRDDPTAAGTDVPIAAVVGGGGFIEWSPYDDMLYEIRRGTNPILNRVDPSTGARTTVATLTGAGWNPTTDSPGFRALSDGSVYMYCRGVLWLYDIPSATLTQAATGLAVGPDGVLGATHNGFVLLGNSGDFGMKYSPATGLVPIGCDDFEADYGGVDTFAGGAQLCTGGPHALSAFALTGPVNQIWEWG